MSSATGERAVYSTDDVRALVQFAADRGVRVVPEVDSLSHTASWSAGATAAVTDECGTLDVTSNASLALVRARGVGGNGVALLRPPHAHRLGRVAARLLEPLNAGGRLPAPRGTAPHPARAAPNRRRLHIAVAQELVSLGEVTVAWQEAMDHYGDTEAQQPTPPPDGLPYSTVIQQWLAPPWNWANLSAITGRGYCATPWDCRGLDAPWPAQFQGFQALSTRGWYLDNTVVNDRKTVYEIEPLTNQSCTYDASGAETCSCRCPARPWQDGRCHCFDLRRSPAAVRVLGGEEALCGEHISTRPTSSLVPFRVRVPSPSGAPPVAPPRTERLFRSASFCLVAPPLAARCCRAVPRHCRPTRAAPRVPARRLWSPMRLNNATAAAARLEGHRCRMLARGVAVTPLGPGHC